MRKRGKKRMADEYIRLDTTIIAIDRLINEAATGTMARTLLKAKDTLYSQQRYVIDVQPVNQWISVKDRLPDKDGNYLCYLECGDICQSVFDSTIASEGEEFPFGEWVGVYNSDTLGFTDSYWEEYDAITNWMPLPEPPKDGDTNG